MQFPFVKLPAFCVLSRDDVVTIWDSMAEYMLDQFALNKGVAIDAFGTFYVLRQHSSEVNRDVIAPRFHLCERAAQTHGISYANRDIPGDLEIVPLDYSLLSSKTSFPEKLVKECVRDLVVLFCWGAGLGEDYDLVFKGIGLLMSRNKILTMRYYEEFLLAVDGTGIVLKCLLLNPRTRYWVLSGEHPDAFHVRPGGIRVLPTFEIKPVPGKKGRDPAPEGSQEREVSVSPPEQQQHRRKRRSPGQLKEAKVEKGQQGRRKKPMDKEGFDHLLPTMGAYLQPAKEEELGEEQAKEREQKGSPAEKRLLAQRRLSTMKLPGVKRDGSVGQQALGIKPPERSELPRAHSATEGSFKSPQDLQLEEHMAKKREQEGSPAEKCLLPRRRLSPVKLPKVKTDDGIGQQALGSEPPESVLPAIEGSSSKEGKSKTTREGRRKAEIPVCKGRRRVGQEVCYLCMQQEERRLRAAQLQEAERQERAEWAEHEACRARMAVLNAQRRHWAEIKLDIAIREEKKTVEEGRAYLSSYCPTPPASVRRRQYDRELRERREVWAKEPRRKPGQLSRQQHESLPAVQSQRRTGVPKAWWEEEKKRAEHNPCRAYGEEQLICTGKKMPLEQRRGRR